ncbi:MAG TPA: type I DNA topoisomerase [bacterium]|nr:type I DNA topoisomerase [bacterium]
MGKSLVIVESEAKSKTINRFLGKDYVVRASIGHVKNLPKNRLGVDIDNGFEPEYITIRGRGKILKELKRIAGASDRIYIATDPDREGEAIAHHLSTEIQGANNRISRVLFYEITQRAIREAIEKSLEVDHNKVEAQKARRVMDRLVGYQVSPFLWKTLYRGLSAGRVQSVALRLVCERETEITEFVTREYWSIEADFETGQHEKFGSKLIKISGRDAEIADESEARKHVEILRGLEYVISSVDEHTIRRNPYPPYTTSTLQQDGTRRLNMTTKRIMAIAQQLYEGIDLPEGRVGLITYMRTDSTRIASSAVEQTRQYIADNYGLRYVPDKPRFFKNRKSAQDAHEAIRPTSLKRTPKSVAPYLTPAQQKLYLLIWNRFVACQMASAKLKQTVVDVTAGDYLFRSTGSIILFKGFMQIWEEMETEETKRSAIPEKITKGETVHLMELNPRQHFTKPPARYNESSLVKELDRLGIGRPSTYALIISTLLDRHYVERENRSLKSTDLGMAVNRILIHQFPDIFNVDFTARMEEELDQIETGEKGRVQVIRDFYGSFMQDMHEAMKKKEAIRESLQDERDEQCPQCGSDLVVKWGRNGRFIACTGYPECKYTRPLERDTVEVDELCEKCGTSMVVKVGRFGRFLACSNYPECKHTKPFSLGIPCPQKDCGGRLIERKSRRGKIFYGCSSYPSCQFATWNRPVARTCPKCQYAIMEEKNTKTRGRFLQCPQCKHIIQQETPE